MSHPSTDFCQPTIILHFNGFPLIPPFLSQPPPIIMPSQKRLTCVWSAAAATPKCHTDIWLLGGTFLKILPLPRTTTDRNPIAILSFYSSFPTDRRTVRPRLGHVRRGAAGEHRPGPGAGQSAAGHRRPPSNHAHQGQSAHLGPGGCRGTAADRLSGHTRKCWEGLLR